MGDSDFAGEAHHETMRIAVLGLGHIGLPTALGLAELGWHVHGADEAKDKVALLREGKIPFYEPGLQPLLSKHLANGKLHLADDVADTVRSAPVSFVCVGTPQREDGEADLAQIESIARTIAQNLNGYKLIVEKSTVPAITAKWVRRTIERYMRAENHARGKNRAGSFNPPGPPGSSGACFDVASNPEFLQEGKAVRDFFHPDRIVLGVDSERARDILETIYRPLQSPILVTDSTTAELIKHASNAFLSTKISFINMVADICEAVGADVTQVARGMGMDPRIGRDFLAAGIRFGGYCFPKDLRPFIHLAEENGVECSLLRQVERINRRRVELLLRRLRQTLWILRGKTIGVLGLAFKPCTDDIREAPSLRIIGALIKEGALLRMYDPQAVPNMQRIYPAEPGRLTYCSSAYEAAQGAHALLLLTEWEEFGRLEMDRLRDLMEIPVMVDGRNCYNPEEMRRLGFEYLSIGRPVHHPLLSSIAGSAEQRVEEPARVRAGER